MQVGAYQTPDLMGAASKGYEAQPELNQRQERGQASNLTTVGRMRPSPEIALRRSPCSTPCNSSSLRRQSRSHQQNPFGPAPQQYMAGTLSPEKQQQSLTQDAIIAALRGM